ncbi:MAG: hypothetical protein Q8P20_01270 [bacterium]|nr:hypothetical protein [bacterium]
MADSASKHILDIQVKLKDSAELQKLKSQLEALGFTAKKSKESFAGFDTGVSRLGGSMSGLSRPAAQAAQMFTVWSGTTLTALNGLNSLKFGILSFKAELIDLYFIGSMKMQGFFKLLSLPGSAIKSFAEFERAVHSAQIAAIQAGAKVSEANALIERSQKRAILSATDSAAVVKELYAAGYDTTQIDKMQVAMESMAVVARQSGLTIGQAVRGTAEGMRFFRNQLLDNTGATQNFDITLKKFAARYNTTVDELNNAQRKLAIFEWITGEGAGYIAAMNQLENDTSRKLDRLNILWSNFKTELGAGLAEPLEAIIELMPTILAMFAKLLEQIALTVLGFKTWYEITKSLSPMYWRDRLIDMIPGVPGKTDPRKSYMQVMEEHYANAAKIEGMYEGFAVEGMTDLVSKIKAGSIPVKSPEQDLTKPDKDASKQISEIQSKLTHGMSSSISDALYNVFAGDQAKSLSELALNFFRGIGRSITDILGNAIATALINSQLGKALSSGLNSVVDTIGGLGTSKANVGKGGVGTVSSGGDLTNALSGLRSGGSGSSLGSMSSNTYNINVNTKVSALDGADATKVLSRNSKVIASQLVDEINKSKKLSDRIRRG